MIHFQCPTCAAPFDVDERLAGRAGRCKKCGGRFKIPSRGAAEAVRAHAAAERPRPVGVAAAAATPNGPRLSPIEPLAPCRAKVRAGWRATDQLARGGQQPGGPGAHQHGQLARDQH